MSVLARFLGLKKSNQDLINIPGLLDIPDPTKSLLWITDEKDLSKVSSSLTITITINLGGVLKKEDHEIYREPSLIWIRLPIEVNSILEKKKMYYPSYASLDSEQRYQYINWLGDVTRQTNLSYVFLYFYGLERHLLLGNYDDAVEEIIRLLKSHKEGTFPSYAVTSLLAASIIKGRTDILDKLSGVDFPRANNLFLATKIKTEVLLVADDILDIAERKGFIKRRLVRENREEITAILTRLIKDQGEDFLHQQDLEASLKSEEICFANPSIPKTLRYIKVPQIMDNEVFSKRIKSLVEAAHKEFLAQTKGSKIRIAKV